MIQLIVLWGAPSWSNTVALAISLVLYGVAFVVANAIYSRNCSLQLERFLDNAIPEGSWLEEFSIEAFVNSQSKSILRALRVFVIRDLPLGYVLCQLKGFILPIRVEMASVQMEHRTHEIARPKMGHSCIFISDAPHDLTVTHSFYVCHELGHATKHAWRIGRRPFEGIATCITLLIWIILGGVSPMLLVALAVYIGLRLSFDLNRSRQLLDDEMLADSVGIRLLPDSTPIDALRNRVVKSLRRNNRGLGERYTAKRIEHLLTQLSMRENAIAPLPIVAMPLPSVMHTCGLAAIYIGLCAGSPTWLGITFLGVLTALGSILHVVITRSHGRIQRRLDMEIDRLCQADFSLQEELAPLPAK